MSYSAQDRLDTMHLEVLFEISIPGAVFLDFVSTELSAMIHNQFPQGMKPPVSIDRLIQDLLAILGIDI